MAQKKTARRKTTPRKTAPKERASRSTATKKTTAHRAAPKTAAKKTWVITTSPDRPMGEIAKDLSDAGFVVDQTLEQIGVITGKSDDRAVGKARAIPGVTDVSPELQVDIGPPNSRDTW